VIAPTLPYHSATSRIVRALGNERYPGKAAWTSTGDDQDANRRQSHFALTQLGAWEAVFSRLGEAWRGSPTVVEPGHGGGDAAIEPLKDGSMTDPI
jgi:hypothetical protein